MADLNNYRRVESEAAKAKLTDLRDEKNEMDQLIRNLESRFLAEFQENYDSSKAQQLRAEIEGMKQSLNNINTEIGNLERIVYGYVESTQNVDETR